MPNNPTWICVTAAALAREDGRWLMHRRPLGKQHGGLWEFPGGKVEAFENPRKALARELREELNILVEPQALEPAGFADFGQTSAGAAPVILLYICRAWQGDPAAQEGGVIDWFRPRQIMQLARPPLDVALCAGLFEKNAGAHVEGQE